MYDISVFNDTLLAFAYTAQESPTYFTNRLFFNPLDLEEDAFLGMVVVKRPVVPAPSDDRGLHLFPNPNRGYGFSVSIRNGSALNYPWRIFDLIGRQVDQGTIFLTGANPSSIPIHRVLLPGYYILNVYQPGGKPIHSTKFVVVR
jgi:hypothetical protein